MKHLKIVIVPAKEEQYLDYISCDLCGERVDSQGYNAEEVTIKHRTGCNYPEAGSGDETSVDLCGKCFDEKLIPWLESLGVKPTTEEWSW
jgi:hypothetical protein